MRDNASSQPAAPTTIWTPANIVTLIRILLVPVFFVACVSPWPTWFPDWNEAELLKPWLAALLFVVLACTDALDGYLARSRGEVTNFGKFMDPLADKILVAAALLALCELQILPSWVALIILRANSSYRVCACSLLLKEWSSQQVGMARQRPSSRSSRSCSSSSRIPNPSSPRQRSRHRSMLFRGSL